MIEIKRSGTQLVISAEIFIGTVGDRTYEATWEAGSEAYAGLIRSEIQRNLERRLERIRREAYAQGWKDAKAKRAKKTLFSGQLD